MSDGQARDLTRFNLIASAVLVLLGLFALLYLIPTHIPTDRGLGQGLSPRFMPTLAAMVLTGLAVVLGGNVLLRRRRGQAPIAEDNEDNDAHGFGWRETVNALILLAGSAVYVFLLESLGFVASSATLLAVCLYFGGVRNWLMLGLICLGLPLALSEILWRLLTIIMPPFPFWV